MFGMNGIMILFFQDSVDYSNQFVIALENGNKITLPYSAQVFAALCQQNNNADYVDDADADADQQ